MSFKGQLVWVKTDESGTPTLDGDGRAEMKYRETDTRSYRPLPQNLAPAGESQPGADSGRHGAEPSRMPWRPSEGDRATKPRKTAAPAPAGEMVHVWTDGACSGNPGPMGIGIVVLAGDRRKEHGEYLGTGTNNIAELVAVQRGLEVAEEVAPGRQQPIRVYTDSSYTIGLLAQGWKAKANQDLVAQLRRQLGSYSNLRFVKVEGHAGVAENERCDLLARQAIARNRHL